VQLGGEWIDGAVTRRVVREAWNRGRFSRQQHSSTTKKIKKAIRQVGVIYEGPKALSAP